ncbi:MAG: uncharacterized protein QOE69_1329 [Thermoleophilaceae bacterium]|jgi:hypothetical protein|nr:uncharacterized protein [Thermoleophilaceae bacterium]MEA2407210.1 uncharacterized protein [Thermoleophilaceae bacterium]
MSRLNELFPAGPTLSEGAQIGRGPSIDALDARVRNGEKVKLLAPRRTGKSSVAGAVTDRLRAAGLPAADADLAVLSGPGEVAEVLRAQLSPGLAALATARRATGWLARQLEAGLGGEDKLIASVLAALGEAGGGSPAAVLQHAADAAVGQAVGVLLDEAHHLATWPEPERQALRAFLREDETVGVIVSSSERSALDKLTGPGGPLQYVGQRLPLPPISREDWMHELPRRFAEAGVPITDDALALLLDEAKLHPYCTMLLAREAARSGQAIGAVTNVIVQAALLTAAEDEAWTLRDDVD